MICLEVSFRKFVHSRRFIQKDEISLQSRVSDVVYPVVPGQMNSKFIFFFWREFERVKHEISGKALSGEQELSF
jgi:hypothetical protein